MREIDECVNTLLDCIHESSIYQNYLRCEKTLAENPDLKKEVDSYRSVIYQMHHEQDWFEASENLETQYAELRKKPEVNAYLDAEVDLCKVIQRVAARICGSLDIQIPGV